MKEGGVRRRWVETLLEENVSDINNTRSSSPAPLPAPSSKGSSITVIGYLIVVGLLLIIGLSLWYIGWYLFRRFRQRQQHETTTLTSAQINDTSNTTENQLDVSNITKERIQRRYETVEHWTITKRVQKHTTCCDMIRRKQSYNLMTITSSSSVDMNENTGIDCCNQIDESAIRNECPICMSEFAAGQIVSWSSNSKCIHVYHHECIKEWLVRHSECCLCKETYLPIDTKKKQQRQRQSKKGMYHPSNFINELSQQFHASVATSYYCIEHGLVNFPESIHFTQSELDQFEHYIMHGAISPTDLRTLRGTTNHNNINNRLLDDGLSNATDVRYNQLDVIENQGIEILESSDDVTLPMDLTASFDSDYVEGGIETAVHQNSNNVDDEDERANNSLDTIHITSSTLSVGQPQPTSDTTVTIDNQNSQSDQSELVSITDYLQSRNQLFLPDNRCCIKESSIQYNNGTGIEVEATTSRRVVDDGEDETHYSSNGDVYSSSHDDSIE